MDNSWFKVVGDKLELKIYAKPNAKLSAITGLDSRGLHIALHATPTSGKANQELVQFLASTFRVRKTKIVIERGATSRLKFVLLPPSTKLNELLKAPLDFIFPITAN